MQTKAGAEPQNNSRDEKHPLLGVGTKILSMQNEFMKQVKPHLKSTLKILEEARRVLKWNKRFGPVRPIPSNRMPHSLQE